VREGTEYRIRVTDQKTGAALLEMDVHQLLMTLAFQGRVYLADLDTVAVIVEKKVGGGVEAVEVSKFERLED